MAASAQYVDRNGYMLVQGCPVTSYGVFDYSAAQVGETDDDNYGDLMRVVKVYRPKESVTDPELAASLKLTPLIDEHDFLNGDPDATEDEGMAPEDKGIDGVSTERVYFEDPWLRTDLKIFSRRLQREIRKGKKDLSLGYTSRFVRKSGVFEGQEYEYIQINMRVNHTALVPEGRVAGARVLDGLVFDSMRLDIIPSKTVERNSEMEENETNDGAPEEVLAAIQALLPKLQAMVAEGGAAASPDNSAAAAPAAGDPAEPVAPAATASEAAPAAGTNDAAGLQAMCDELEALLPMLKAKAAGTAGGAEPATPAEPAAAPASAETGDAVGGLEDTGATSSVTPVEAGTKETDADVGGKTSPGPAAGEHATGDAAMKNLYADIADRDRYYGLISREIGAFDHKSLTATEVVAYGNKKLGLNAPKGSERIALDSYFLGKGKAAPAKAITTNDSRSTAPTGDLAKYLSE